MIEMKKIFQCCLSGMFRKQDGPFLVTAVIWPCRLCVVPGCDMSFVGVRLWGGGLARIPS